MKKCSANEVKKVMGLDLGDRKSCYLVVDEEGVIGAEGQERTEAGSLRRLFEQWAGCRVVMETGTHSPWVSRVARAAGCEVVVANARQLELISKNRRKGDRVDARLLARLGRADVELLAPVRHRSRADAPLLSACAVPAVRSRRSAGCSAARGPARHRHRSRVRAAP